MAFPRTNSKGAAVAELDFGSLWLKSVLAVWAAESKPKDIFHLLPLTLGSQAFQHPILGTKLLMTQAPENSSAALLSKMAMNLRNKWRTLVPEHNSIFVFQSTGQVLPPSTSHFSSLYPADLGLCLISSAHSKLFVNSCYSPGPWKGLLCFI